MHRNIVLALTAEVGRRTCGVEFAPDSSLEESGIELPVPPSGQGFQFLLSTLTQPSLPTGRLAPGLGD
jgi:hypothetical protein